MKNCVLILFACLIQTVLVGQEFKEKTITFSLDLTRPVEANTLPKIQWFTPTLELTGSPNAEAMVEALIDSHHAIREIKITVKSGDQSNAQNVNVADNEFSKTIALKVTLYDGNNEITLTATNNKGGKVSSFRSIKVGKDILSKLQFANRKDYALIFATDRYENWSGLNNPIAGAEALNSMLKADYGFETELIKNPSLKDIQRKLSEYESKSYSSQDQLLVYFAGHCFFDNLMGFGYVVAANSAKNDPKKSSYLAQKDLRLDLNKFKCDHIFLAMDLCCADLADTRFESGLPVNNITQAGLVDKLNIKTRKFLNGGDTEYKADNVPGNFSPFTTQLIESLKQNSEKRKPKTFSEINFYFKNLEIYSGSFGEDSPQSEFLFIPK